MGKYSIKFLIIILVNLFAFLTVGHILDVFFQTGNKIMVISLILSIIPLIIIMTFEIKKFNKEINQIKEKKDEQSK